MNNLKGTFFMFILLMTACSKINIGNKNDDTKNSILEKIAFVWIASSVLEDGLTVYNQGASQNIKAYYANFIIDLSNLPRVKITEIDGLSFEGQVSLDSNNLLILSSLTPVPYGTEGKMQFTVESYSETELVLVRKDENFKTGATLTKYNLRLK